MTGPYSTWEAEAKTLREQNRELALQALASDGQAAEAHEARLIAEDQAKALRADNERLRDALRFYANPAVYDIPDNGYELVCADAGEIARAALKQEGGK